jgi:hypothetical protein
VRTSDQQLCKVLLPCWNWQPHLRLAGKVTAVNGVSMAPFTQLGAHGSNNSSSSSSSSGAGEFPCFALH